MNEKKNRRGKKKLMRKKKMKNKELKREMKRKKHLKYIPWQSQDDPNNIDYDSLCEKRSL